MKNYQTKLNNLTETYNELVDMYHKYNYEIAMIQEKQGLICEKICKLNDKLHELDQEAKSNGIELEIKVKSLVD